MLICSNCGKPTGHKRALGFGTLFIVFLTGGLWLLAIPFYPVRCIICGGTTKEIIKEAIVVGERFSRKKSHVVLVSIILFLLLASATATYVYIEHSSWVFVKCASNETATCPLVWKLKAMFGNANAQYQLGRMYYTGNGATLNYTKAVEWFQKAAEQGNADAQYNLGVMYDNGEGVPTNPTKAVEWYQRAAEQGHADAQVEAAKNYNKQGAANITSGDYLGAIQDYNKAIELNPKSAEYYNDRGVAKKKLGDFTGAIHDYTKAIELNPSAITYNNRGGAKIHLKDYTGAIQDCNKAIELDPNYAEAYLIRGLVKAELEDYTGALIDLSKAEKLGQTEAGELIRAIQKMRQKRIFLNSMFYRMPY